MGTSEANSNSDITSLLGEAYGQVSRPFVTVWVDLLPTTAFEISKSMILRTLSRIIMFEGLTSLCKIPKYCNYARPNEIWRLQSKIF